MKFVVISGCSGGGKSTLLVELARRGHATVEEPGRRIVREEMLHGGEALPWVDAAAFARRAIALSLEDRDAVRGKCGTVFFDRSLIDAAAFLEHVSREQIVAPLAARHRYCSLVFMAPPWPALFQTDSERMHDFAAAEAEYRRLLEVYANCGYECIVIPKSCVGARADFVLERLRAAPHQSVLQPS